MATWILNLDSDYELAAGSGYAPRRAVLEKLAPFVERLANTLLPAGDTLIGGHDARETAPGRVGRAWSPTPRAIAALRAAGAVPAPHPSVEVLRRVTSRAFAAALGATMPGAQFVTRVEDALATLGSGEQPWRLKRAYGMAGRDHRIVSPGRVTDADLGFVRASIAEGGIQIEPNVAIETEYSLHAYIEEDGSTRFGALFQQRCTQQGSWLASVEIDEPERERAMNTEARRAGSWLFENGYFGAFGIDAFTYRVDGRLQFQPRSEVNARFTMGYPRALIHPLDG